MGCNMIRRSALCCLMILLGATAARANSLEINLNEDAARIGYGWSLFDDQMSLDLGWLRQQDDGDVGHVGFHRVGETAVAGNHSIRAGLGGRVVHVDANPVDGYVLGLGGFVRMQMPFHERLGLGAHVYFGPEVLSGGDLEKYREVGLRAAYKILEGADIYLGYRYIKASFEQSPSVTLDEDAHIGLSLRF